MSAEYILNRVTFDEIELFFEAIAETRDMWQERFGWVCHSIYNSLNLSHGGEAIPIEKFMPDSWEPPEPQPEEQAEKIDVEAEKTRLQKMAAALGNMLNKKK